MSKLETDDKALFLAKKKPEELIKSDNFKFFDELGEIHACNVVTNATKHHIRVMLEILNDLT